MDPKSLTPDWFGKTSGPSWRTWSYSARDFAGVVPSALKQAMQTGSQFPIRISKTSARRRKWTNSCNISSFGWKYFVEQNGTRKRTMAKIGCSLWSTGSWTQSGRRQADLVSATSYHDRRPLARSPSLGKPRTKTPGTLWRPATRRHATCCSALHVPIKLTICSVSKSRIPFKLSSSSFMPLLWWHVFSSISLFATSVIQPLAVNAAQVEIPPNTSHDGFANHFPSNCDLASWCNPVWQQETAGKSSPHLGRTWAKAILKVRDG